MASGLFAYLDDATATKPIHPAWAAHGALLATRLAAHGAEGPSGRAGGPLRRLPRLRRHADRPRAPARRSGLEVGDTADRLQGVPRVPLHPRLARRDGETLEGLDPNEIEDVVVTVPEAGVSLVLEPADRKKVPRSDYEGKFSLQFSTASMLVRGRVGLTDLHARRAQRRARARAVARKVRHETKEYASYPAAFPGGVRIRMNDGRTLEADFPYQLGGPENPMSADEVRAKFRDNARLAGGSFDALEEAILTLEEQDDLRRGGPLRSPASRSPHERDRAQRRAAGDRRDRPRVRRPRGDPGRVRARARRRVPDGARRDDEGDGPVRDDDPRGVRRPRARPRHVRADPDRALARLDVAARES